ncbi:MAG: DNA double-strand break repair nuclease NurA [Candidatus Nezhaarchaeota archaeon]|nr:DNA double-strand break repair nuclease NurA [Candidatus Nezhaarchaeota archaeon]
MSLWEEDVKEVRSAVENVKRLQFTSTLNSAYTHWVKVEEWRRCEEPEFIGIDGSFRVRPLSFSTLYLARAIALGSSIGNVRRSKSELLTTVNDDQAKQHAKAVMSMLEVEVASNALKKALDRGITCTLLFDGSLSAIILSRSPKKASLRRATIRNLSSLIEQCEAIFIAKRSSKDEYVKGIPDIMLFSSMPMGYSKPRYTSLPSHYGIPETSQECSRLTSKLKTITVFYARFTEGGPLLMVEVPGRKTEEEVSEIASKIRTTSPTGYPVPLLAAHKNVKISSLLVKKALSVTGLRALSGREVLGEGLI